MYADVVLFLKVHYKYSDECQIQHTVMLLSGKKVVCCSFWSAH